MIRRISFFIILSILVLNLSNISIYAEESDTLYIPEPIKAIDFSYSFEELSEQHEGVNVVDNAAEPILVLDEEMGQVLKLGKTISKNKEYAMQGGLETSYILSDESDYSTISISNPYKGMEQLVEYMPYEDVKTTLYGNCQQPLWEKGITISYWINVPVNENGIGINSNVLGFTSERFQIQADDYAKHLCTVKYDLDYNMYTDAEKETLGITESGVDKDSDFYFEFDEEKTYNGKPLYDYETIGRMYWMNKNFINGYLRFDDGTIMPCEEVNGFDSEISYYNYYSEAPYLGNDATSYDSGKSNLRFAWTYSEMWLDSTSSFYFENDNPYTNEQLNSNHSESYKTIMGMQENNSFSINSWKNNTTYMEAMEDELVADSPASIPNEWHYVTVIIQNDWVKYYLDGKELDIVNEYSSYGLDSLPIASGSFRPWSRFNKGTGSRYGYGSWDNKTYWCYYGDYCSPTIMEWITLDCVEMTIGGGNRNGDAYNMYADTDEILIKNIVFYDSILTDEQIDYLATKPNLFGTEYQGAVGDLNLDKKITSRDALLLLKHAARIEVLDEDMSVLADVNGDSIVNTEDALHILKYVAGLAKDWSVDGVIY